MAVVGKGFLQGVAGTEGVGQARLDEDADGIKFLPRGKERGADGVKILNKCGTMVSRSSTF